VEHESVDTLVAEIVVACEFNSTICFLAEVAEFFFHL
jgi:hypothetical protein